MLRRRLLAAAQLLLLTFFHSYTFGQEPSGWTETIAPQVKLAQRYGLLTDRLSTKEYERWKEIESLVFAEDDDRQPLHPTLRWMWEWIDTSGHAIFVEIIRVNRASTCTAGNFQIERFDRLGEKHIAVIKLNLPNIDQAYIGPTTQRQDGFIPFTNLSKEERYAEVLGHEMAHAVHILTSLKRTRLVVDYVEVTNETLLRQNVRQRTGFITPDLKLRITKRDALLKELEAQAEAMEKIVWQELVASKPDRDKPRMRNK